MARGWSQIRAEIIAAAASQPGFAGRSEAQIVRGLSVASPLVQGALVAAVRAGSVASARWTPVTVTRGALTAVYHVSEDCLRVGTNADYVRPNVSQLTSQTLADILGVRVASTLILDAVQAQAAIPIDCAGSRLPARRGDGTSGTDLVRNGPKPGVIAMSLEAMEEESRRVDALIGSTIGLVGGVGKSWTPDAELSHLEALKARAANAKTPRPYYGKETACNYGFWAKGGPRPTMTPVAGWRVYQQPGFAHDLHHSDYSQRGPRMVVPHAFVSGPDFGQAMPVDVDTIALDPLLCRLYHYDGRPGPARHPWIPWCGSGPPPAGAGSGAGGGGDGITTEGAICYVGSDETGAPLPEPRPSRLGWGIVALGATAATAAVRYL